MKRRVIFEDTLHACIWEDSRVDAFADAFDNWTDVGWLAQHFTLNTGVFEEYPMTVLEAINRTRDEALKFKMQFGQQRNNLDVMFQPLDNRSTGRKTNEQYKSKRKWLRIYALRIDSDTYFVTGSAIKHTEEMKDHPLTNKEKRRLDQCKAFLTKAGVVFKEGFIELDDTE